MNLAIVQRKVKDDLTLHFGTSKSLSIEGQAGTLQRFEEER